MLNWSIIYFLDTPQIFPLINSQFLDREPLTNNLSHSTRNSGVGGRLLSQRLDDLNRQFPFSDQEFLVQLRSTSTNGQKRPRVAMWAARPLPFISLAHFSSPLTLGQERKLSLSNSHTLSHSYSNPHLCEWDWSEFFVDFNSRSKILLLSTCGTRRRFDFISITLGSWNPSQLGVAWWRPWFILVRAPGKIVLPFDSSGNPGLIFVVAWEEGGLKETLRTFVVASTMGT